MYIFKNVTEQSTNVVTNDSNNQRRQHHTEKKNMIIDVRKILEKDQEKKVLIFLKFILHLISFTYKSS